ncbi:MAG: hypothetical protein ACMUEM_05125 [Flavobacteriales bacterium AspAUS03]
MPSVWMLSRKSPASGFEGKYSHLVGGVAWINRESLEDGGGRPR